jgi:hypothetical protein
LKTNPVSRIFLSAVTLMVLAAPAKANLVTNGSFENTTGFVSNGQDTMSLAIGSTTMTGWKVIGDFVAWIGPNNPFNLTASAGSYFLDLTDYQPGAPFGGVEQTISTVAGQSYQLSFDLGSSSQFVSTSGILASAGATSQSFSNTLTGANQWQPFTLSFTANTALTTISLVGQAGVSYIGLDNVSVEATDGNNGVPEPASLALLGIGLTALTAMRRRKA